MILNNFDLNIVPIYILLHMKTIQFRTDDLTQYTVNIEQITCMFPVEESLGTWIHLSCGTRLKTIFTLDTIVDMIKECLL